MTLTAFVIAPGRGTYSRSELGYLARHHPGSAAVAEVDALRLAEGQQAVSALDGADRFSVATHTRGDNAAALIHACAFADFQAIDRDRFDILGVTGNSMGWYIALACAGALSPVDGARLVNTMGGLMHDHLIGGQLIYPFMDDSWGEIPGLRGDIMEAVAQIDAQPGHALGLSIDLGGMLVLAGNDAGLAAFESSMPIVQDRFPMRLHNHAAFHTDLQAPVAAEGRARLPRDMMRQPGLAMIDGRGALWHPGACDLTALYDYTLGQQVTQPYDFTAAIRVAARELMPDVFIILGPGTTLGGAVSQSLVRAGWRGWGGKADVKAAGPVILSMGDAAQRGAVARGG
ncbi:ACP S-malonyltransferase [Aliiroseovarius subalbicans]|uniref:ACP S-malonyltransferase n=1 Tax=Aliiroseovarius subalbicans TaxID=2925840 RepID=UPI001F5661CE|nr:ACP S-malonyltransferase [Aliiroseovarius subalbicans]MCI2400437.1 ACP S-malonyltransferase [Aliiroseovarius subalbicans]